MKQLFIKFMEVLKVNTPHHTKVELAIQYITEHYNQDLSVDYIAEHVELNSAYLSRIFKQTTGKTILEYLTLLRIDESKHLLLHSKQNIHEIAQKVGYNNTNSFIRFFRKYEGITPGEYRKTHLNNTNS
jgi:two-component system response regulator YesN